MTKTIEEAAREASVSYCSKFATHQEPYEIAFTEFLNGAGYIMSLPLSQRLTDEEREKIKAKHNACRIAQTECDCLDYEIAADMLEEIFGKELFGEGEG